MEGSPASLARARARLLTAALVLAALPGCELPGSDRPSPFFAAFALYGTWQWSHAVDDPGLHRVERELWKWIPASTPGVVYGQYLREVTVTSDNLPFACNQDLQYTQRAWFEVEARAVTVTDDAPASGAGARKKPKRSIKIEIVETSYRTEPSPCDHGFRKLGRYLVTTHGSGGDRAVLSFPEGRQTLHRTSEAGGPLAVPWERHPPALAGPWRWSTQSVDEQGLWRTEDERWELALSQAGFDLGMGAAAEHAKIFDAVVTRRVRITSPDGSIIPCAGAPSYGFEDRYVLDGKRRGTLMALQETGVAAGEHPCLRARSERTLDTATLERLGDFLVLEWRGKRRQVLHRPHSIPPAAIPPSPHGT
jgi:hypothetical protein